jgi:hypothetical protein
MHFIEFLAIGSVLSSICFDSNLMSSHVMSCHVTLCHDIKWHMSMSWKHWIFRNIPHFKASRFFSRFWAENFPIFPDFWKIFPDFGVDWKLIFRDDTSIGRPPLAKIQKRFAMSEIVHRQWLICYILFMFVTVFFNELINFEIFEFHVDFVVVSCYIQFVIFMSFHVT